DTEHLAGGGIVRRQGIVADRIGPAVLKHIRARLDTDVGIDQRTSADTRTLDNAHIAKIAEIDPAVLALRLIFIPQPVLLADTGIVLHLPAAPPLEHQHPGAFLLQAARHDGATEATANHDGIEIAHP